MNKIITLFTLVLILQSCTSIKTKNIDLNTIYIYQNNKLIPVNKDYSEIDLLREEFSLRFYNKAYKPKKDEYYAAQIAAFKNRNDIKKYSIGMNIEELECFAPGTGMATRGNYEYLYLTTSGHHYVHYKNKNNKRLNLIDKIKDYLLLEFEINRTFINDNSVPLSEVQINNFYLLIFIDRNLNNIIDKKELKLIKINLI